MSISIDQGSMPVSTVTTVLRNSAKRAETGKEFQGAFEACMAALSLIQQPTSPAAMQVVMVGQSGGQPLNPGLPVNEVIQNVEMSASVGGAAALISSDTLLTAALRSVEPGAVPVGSESEPKQTDTVGTDSGAAVSMVGEMAAITAAGVFFAAGESSADTTPVAQIAEPAPVGLAENPAGPALAGVPEFGAATVGIRASLDYQGQTRPKTFAVQAGVASNDVAASRTVAQATALTLDAEPTVASLADAASVRRGPEMGLQQAKPDTKIAQPLTAEGATRTAPAVTGQTKAEEIPSNSRSDRQGNVVDAMETQAAPKPTNQARSTVQNDKPMMASQVQASPAQARTRVEAEEAFARQVLFPVERQAVAATAQPLSTTTPVTGPSFEERKEVIDQVVRAMQSMKVASDTEVRVRLEPRELGEVWLRVSSTQDGLVADFKVTTEMARATVQQGLQELKQNLAQAGMKVNTMTCDLGQAFGQASDSQKQGSQPRRPGYRIRNDDERQMAPVAHRVWQRQSGLDMIA